MKIENEIKLDFSDVLIKPKRSTLSSRKEVDLTRSFKFKNGYEYNGIPIISSNMEASGTTQIAHVFNQFALSTAIHKFYTTEELISFFSKEENKNHFYSMGIADADTEKFEYVYEQSKFIKFVCIDVANGYQEQFVSFITNFKRVYPDVIIMAGNVCSAEMTEALILAGVEIVKVGIGSGGLCLTRNVAGVGVPQLSAIIECADAAHGLGGLVCSDGGITCSGDVSKAFGAGADFVMIGSLFAGHNESGGELVCNIVEDKKFKRSFGMSSNDAMQKFYGSVADHRTSEGRSVLVPLKGNIETTIKEILGGLRSTCTYTGSAKLKELSKRTTFIRVTNQINNIFNDKK